MSPTDFHFLALEFQAVEEWRNYRAGVTAAQLDVIHHDRKRGKAKFDPLRFFPGHERKSAQGIEPMKPDPNWTPEERKAAIAEYRRRMREYWKTPSNA